MPISEKAATNILRLLHTEDKRNGILAFRLLKSQGVVKDFILSLYGHLIFSSGERRLALQRCLKALFRQAAEAGKCSSEDVNQLMWTLNLDLLAKAEPAEAHLRRLEKILHLDILVLARYIFSRNGQCGVLLFEHGNANDKAALMECRLYDGPYGHTLDMSGLGLTSPPAEIGQFEQIEALCLSYNKLKAFDFPASQRLRKLRRIDLAHNQMTDIPSVFFVLDGLQKRDLRHNIITLSFFDYLRHPLKDTLRITLRKEAGFTLNDFNSQDTICLLKNWIFDVGRRQVLNLRHQKLQSIPLEIQHYPNLEIIDLRNNPIGFIPNWLLQQRGLRILYCDAGVEYNPAFRTKGLDVRKDSPDSLPTPEEEPPPWRSNLAAFPAELPARIPLEGWTGA